MKVKEMIEKLNLTLLTKDVSEDALYAEVEGGYASDLLSNAMGQAQPGMVWVTMQDCFWAKKLACQLNPTWIKRLETPNMSSISHDRPGPSNILLIVSKNASK